MNVFNDARAGARAVAETLRRASGDGWDAHGIVAFEIFNAVGRRAPRSGFAKINRDSGDRGLTGRFFLYFDDNSIAFVNLDNAPSAHDSRYEPWSYSCSFGARRPTSFTDDLGFYHQS